MTQKHDRQSFAGFMAVLICMTVLSGCGYQMVREKGIYGGDITSVYIAVFKNSTFEPHASLYVTDAFSKELLATGQFTMNRDRSDAYIQGDIKKITMLPASLSADGLVIEKQITVDIELSLYRNNGTFMKRWNISDTETYRVDSVDAEDYNKREALRRLAARSARRFSSAVLVDY